MAGKQMNQLSTLSTVADTDLLLLYDVDEGGSEKTKSITYSEFETQISGAVGGDSSNPESLYYNGTDVKATATAAGISITDGTSVGVRLVYVSDDLHIINDDPNGEINFLAKNSADDAWHNMCEMRPDAMVKLKYNNVESFETISGGIAIPESGSSDFNLRRVTGDTWFESRHDSGKLLFKGDDDESATVNLMSLDPDGAVDLYYAGVKTLETIAGGINIYDDDESDFLSITHNGTHAILSNTTALGGFYLRVGSENGIVINPGAAVNLYYNNLLRLITTLEGIHVSSGTNTVAIRSWGSDFAFTQTEVSSRYIFKGKNSANATTDMCYMDPDGPVNLYYAGTLAASSFVSATLTGMSFPGPGYVMTNSADSGLVLLNGAVSGSIYMQATNAASATKTLLLANPDGAAELYYAGVLKLATTSTGLSITGAAEPWVIQSLSGAMYFTNQNHGYGYRFDAENNAGLNKQCWTADPDGAFEIFHAGTKILTSKASGFYINSGADSANITLSTDLYYQNSVHGGRQIFKAEDTAGANKNMLILDPDGPAELYHAGDKQLETVVSGVEIPEDSFMYFGDTTTSGSWRMGISGEDFIHQKYDGADWVTKQTVVG